MWLRILPLLYILAVPASAAEWIYIRADGRPVHLTPVLEKGVYVLPAAGRARPVELTPQLVLRTKRKVDDSDLKGFGLRLVRPMGGLDFTWLLAAANPKSAVQACHSLAGEDWVIWAVPDFRIPVEAMHTPSDPLYDLQWHLKDEQGQDLAMEGAWDMTTGDAQVVVAILDTGVDSSHLDLDPARMVAPRNEVANSSDGSPSELAIDHHGTACAGLIAADMDNGEGVVGICPDCSWMPVRIFARGAIMNLSALSDGVSWAVDNGAWVLSNSWGIGQELIDQGVDVAPVQDAVRHAVQTGRSGKGSVVLFAAGNGDSELNAQPIGPDELPAMSETIAVGGSDHLGAVAKYSDYGSCVSVLAPTWSGYSDEPHIVTIDTSGTDGANKDGVNFRTEPGGGDTSAGWPEPDAAGNYTGRFTGTSAATPMAAGVAALVLSVDPELTWQQVMDILEQTAEKVGLQAEDPRRVAAYDEAGHDDHYGHGRVHAERAVAVARYGIDQADGQACRLDLNCLGVCRADTPLSDAPVCVTLCDEVQPCAAPQVCQAGICLGGSDPDGGGDELVIKGGCACGSEPPAGVGAGWLLLLCCFFCLKRRPV